MALYVNIKDKDREGGKRLTMEELPKRLYQVHFWGETKDGAFSFNDLEVKEYVFKEIYEDSEGKHAVWDLLPDRNPRRACEVDLSDGGLASRGLMLNNLWDCGDLDYGEGFESYVVWSQSLERAKELIAGGMRDKIKGLEKKVRELKEGLVKLEVKEVKNE